MYSRKAITDRIEFYQKIIIGTHLSYRQLLSERAQKRNPDIEQLKNSHFPGTIQAERVRERSMVPSSARKEFTYPQVRTRLKILKSARTKPDAPAHRWSRKEKRHFP